MCALSLAVVAAALLGLSTTVSSPLPWRWLGLSAASMAVSSTADLLALSLPGWTATGVVQTVSYTVGCLLLLEFARRCWAVAGGRLVGPWVVAVLAALSALGLFAGVAGFEAAASYFLGVAGGLWAAAALWRFARRGDRHRRPLMVAAASLIGVVVVEFGVPVRASFPPAEWINQPWFHDALGFPVGLLAMGFAVPFVFALWYTYRTLLKEEHPGLVDRRELLFEAGVALALAALLAGGLYTTALVGRHADSDARRSLLGRAQLAVGGIDPVQVAAQTATPADLGTRHYERLREQLLLMTTGERGPPLAPSHDGEERQRSCSPSTGSRSPTAATRSPGHPIGIHRRHWRRCFGMGRRSLSGRTPTNTAPSSPRSPPCGSLSARVCSACSASDVDASAWAATVAEQRLEPLLITLLLALMVIGFYVVQERRRIDALTLAESEREYRSVLESMGDVFYRSDRDGRLIMASPSFAHVLGYDSVDDAIGMDLAQNVLRETLLSAALFSSASSATVRRATSR